MTLDDVSVSLWKVTTPAWLVPSVDVHAMRSSGCCSVISASNSRVTPAMSVTQCVWVSSTWVMDSTPSMNSGNDSNRVHWLYATRAGTSTSMDCSTVVMSSPRSADVQL